MITSLAANGTGRFSFLRQRSASSRKCALRVTAERVYTQSPTAHLRSRLSSAPAQIPRSELPRPGDMTAARTTGAVDGAEYDRANPQRLKATIY